MKKRKVPIRRCLGCHESKPKKDLIRVVKTKEGKVIVDLTGKANGRGAYICNNTECFNKAKKNKGFNRALEMNLPEEIYEELLKELENNE